MNNRRQFCTEEYKFDRVGLHNAVRLKSSLAFMQMKLSNLIHLHGICDLFFSPLFSLACIFGSILDYLSASGFPGLNIKKQHVPYNASSNALEASVLNILGDQAIHCQVILSN